ncbi:hypothetical protein MRX56_08925 [Pseudodesulfovibrio sp. S3-i]|nr:hypothetical protein [Pseudodesulfovibrio sp. S3-i]
MNCRKTLCAWAKDNMVKLAWIAVGLGVLVLVGYLALAAAGGELFGAALDLDKSAHIGTFVGGTVGALWALAGVFFFFAALQLQREELEATRKAFERQAFETTFFNIIAYKNEVQKQRHINKNGSGITNIEHTHQLLADFNVSDIFEIGTYEEVFDFLNIVKSALWVLDDYLSRDGVNAVEKEKYKKDYMHILVNTTTQKGRVVFLYYVFKFDDECKNLACNLGFFDGLLMCNFHGKMPYTAFTGMNKRDGLIYYKPPESEA